MNQTRYNELKFKDTVIEQFEKVITVLGFFNKWAFRYIALSVVLSHFGIVELPYVILFVYVIAVGLPLGIVLALIKAIAETAFKSNKDYFEYKHIKFKALMDSFFKSKEGKE